MLRKTFRSMVVGSVIALGAFEGPVALAGGGPATPVLYEDISGHWTPMRSVSVNTLVRFELLFRHSGWRNPTANLVIHPAGHASPVLFRVPMKRLSIPGGYTRFRATFWLSKGQAVGSLLGRLQALFKVSAAGSRAEVIPLSFRVHLPTAGGS
jgi:hypothetical protein